MADDQCPDGAKNRAIERRRVLKAASAVGFAGAGIFGSASASNPYACRYTVESSINEGQTFEQSANGSIEVDLLDRTDYVDNNWRLGYLGRVGETYHFALVGVFNHYYVDDTGAGPFGSTENLNVDIVLEDADYPRSTGITILEDVTRTYELTASDWIRWYRNEQIDPSDEDDLDERIEDVLRDDDDFDFPEAEDLSGEESDIRDHFFSTANFVGGIAAGALGIGALSVGSSVVSGLLLARGITSTLSSGCTVDIDSDVYDQHAWSHTEFCGPRPLVTHTLEFSVNHDSERSSSVVSVYQSYESYGGAVNNMEVDNIASWAIRIPSREGSPSLCSGSTHFDEDGAGYLI